MSLEIHTNAETGYVHVSAGKIWLCQLNYPVTVKPSEARDLAGHCRTLARNKMRAQYEINLHRPDRVFCLEVPRDELCPLASELDATADQIEERARA